MGQTLTNGIYLPDEGEVRCYDGLASNWTTLDAVVGGYRAHVANENIHITSAERNKWDTGLTQAYVLRYASVSLTALGTVAFSALDNTDNIKIGDKVLDSEGKLFALTAVDTANTSATLSALLIDLSKDSDLNNYYTKGETDTLLSDKANDTDAVHKSGAETIAGLKTFSDTVTVPSINGLNPGALSLPNLSAGVDISGYITDLAGASNINRFTPTADGWISIGLSNADFIELYIPSALMGGSFTKSSINNYSQAFMPVIANKEVRITLKGSSIGWAKFYPCWGNV